MTSAGPTSSTVFLGRVTLLFILALPALIFINPAAGYLDVNQYCRAFDPNFQPIICLIKNGTNTQPANHTPYPHPPPTNFPILLPPDDSDFDDDECSCEVRCVPRFIHQRSLISTIPTGNFDHSHNLLRTRIKRSLPSLPSTSYRCRSCGTECPVSTNRQPRCNCVVPTAKSECTCTATCAMFRFNPFNFQKYDDDDDANCILSVTALEDWRLGEERPPYSCECERSKEAENSRKPDFVCVCQRVSRD